MNETELVEILTLSIFINKNAFVTVYRTNADLKTIKSHPYVCVVLWLYHRLLDGIIFNRMMSDVDSYIITIVIYYIIVIIVVKGEHSSWVDILRN